MNLTTEQLTTYRALALAAIKRFRDAARYDEPVSTSVTIPAEHVLHLITAYEATSACRAYDMEHHYACHRLWAGDLAYHVAFPEAAELINREELHPYTNLDVDRSR